MLIYIVLYSTIKGELKMHYKIKIIIMCWSQKQCIHCVPVSVATHVEKGNTISLDMEWNL